MLNQLSEIAPAGALFAAIAWGGLSYFATGPEIAGRIARIDYVPACERMLETSIASSFEGKLAQVSQSSEIERQGAAAGAYMGGMTQQYPEHMQFLDMITGGGFSGSVQAMNGVAREAREARSRAEAAIKRQRKAALESAPDQCSCQVAAATNDSRNDWALFAGSFGLIEQNGVTKFASLMRANARMCADRVQL
ncbi:hypothetical protein [Roseovarius sp. MBR-154]|jgi:hypothetical protein